jgi:hypothetical protein
MLSQTDHLIRKVTPHSVHEVAEDTAAEPFLFLGVSKPVLITFGQVQNGTLPLYPQL